MTNLPAKIAILKADITKLAVDAIVNAANSSLLGGGGVDGAIHRAGGPAILEDCRKIISRQGGCATGHAVITTGGNLPARYVIHTVGPVWNGGHGNERQLLADCYSHSLDLGKAHNCKSIAFPNISTGIYGFPKEEAAKIAIETVLSWLSGNDAFERIIFVCFNDENYRLFEKYLNLLSPR